MFCSECGKKIKNDSLFCPYCGADLRENNRNEEDEIEKVPEVDEEQLEMEKNEDSVKKGNKEQLEKKKQEWRNKTRTAIEKGKEFGKIIENSGKKGKKFKTIMAVFVLFALLVLAVVAGRSFLLRNKSEDKLKTGFYIKKEESIYDKNGKEIQSQIGNESGKLQIVWDDYVNGNYYYVDEEQTLYYNTNFGKNSVKLDEDVTTLTDLRGILTTPYLWQNQCAKIQFMKQAGLETDMTTSYYSANGSKPIRVRNHVGIVFSQNGRYAAYMKNDLGETMLYVTDLQTSQEEKIDTYERTGYVLNVGDDKSVYYRLNGDSTTDTAWYCWNSKSRQEEKIIQANEGYFNATEGKLLAVNSSGDLLYKDIYDKEGENKKIASNVQQYFLFAKEKSDLISGFNTEIDLDWEEIVYIKDNVCYLKSLNSDKEAEKIIGGKQYVTNIKVAKDRKRVFAVTENGLYYTDKQKDGWSEKEKIASNVTWYEISEDGKEVVLLHTDSELTYWKDGKEEQTLDEEVTSGYTQFEKEGVLYITQDQSFYYQPFSEKKEKIKLSDDVEKYVVSDNEIYYVTNENTLYKIQADGNKKEKIMDDVDDLIIYQYE